jgi:hypothetical protein
MSTNRDKFLTEAMGECWHEHNTTHPIKSWGSCTCGSDFVSHWSLQDHLININPNFSTWEGFGKLWEWAWKQEWWASFVRYANKLSDTEFLGGFICPVYTNPDTFADAVYTYLKEAR